MSRICPACQAALTPKSRFCPSCGSATPLEETIDTPTSQATQVSRGSGAGAAPSTRTLDVPVPPASVPAAEPPPVIPPPPPAPPPPALPPVVAAPAAARTTRSPFGEGPCPLGLWLNLPHAFVAGHSSTLVFRLQNEGAAPLENGEVYVSSRGLADESISRFRRLPPAGRQELLVEIEASRPGHFVLQVAISWDQGGQRYAYRGQHALRIYKAPENSNIVINISDLQSNTGGGANQALGAEYGDIQISNLIAKGAIKTVNDLLDLELPENFQRVELDLDYEVSRQDVGSRAPSRPGGQQVPPALLATVQPATVCTFETVGAGAPPLPFRLIARPQFKLGRARADADFISWVLPRSPGNDEKTMRVSKVQAVAEATAAGVILRDNASANGTLFDGVPLDENGTSLTRQGRLLLAGAVEVDFNRLPPWSDREPSLANGRAWSGPAPTAPAQRGAVRFEIVSPDEQPLNAVWLLTDAAFGTSRSNAVALKDDAVAEIQGRFHHYRGCFWVETLLDNSAVQLDRLTLRPGELAPLATGQQLRIGSRIWRLRLEA